MAGEVQLLIIKKKFLSLGVHYGDHKNISQILKSLTVSGSRGCVGEQCLLTALPEERRGGAEDSRSPFPGPSRDPHTVDRECAVCSITLCPDLGGESFVL